MTAATPLALTRPGQALSIYQSVDGAPGAQQSGSDFGALLNRSLQGAVESGRQADAQSMQAISGGGDLTQVVAAVSRAQLALQTTVAVRDRVIQAYQDVIKMPI